MSRKVHYVNCLDCGIQTNIEEDSSDLMHYCSRCHRLRNLEAENAVLKKKINGMMSNAEMQVYIDGIEKLETDNAALKEDRVEYDAHAAMFVREMFKRNDRITALRTKCENQQTRIAYLEGATSHATGTPLSKALARAETAEAALKNVRTEPAPGDLVVVAHWSDFDINDATVLGVLYEIRDGYFYIDGSKRGWRHCKLVKSKDRAILEAKKEEK